MNQRESALAIFRAALAAANPRDAVARAMQRNGNTLHIAERTYDLTPIERVFVIGFGKASAAMAQAAETILGDKITRGWVTVKYGHTAPLTTGKIVLHQAGHPLLDENSLRGTAQILELLDHATANDLILCLISGGGSALLELPVADVSLGDLRATNDALLRSGATINEMNTLRKHLSQVKGGQLARRAGKAQVIALVLSDVIGSPLDTIASGPTAPDSTTFADARAVIERHNLRAQLPPSVSAHLDRGARGTIADTPKPSDALFARTQNVIIADNAIACQAAVAQAQALGYHALLLTTYLQGEARQVAQVFASIAKEIARADRPVARPACVIAGGETTVTIQGNGKGGRSQEFALAAALALDGMNQVVVLSGGTDGNDGPTDAAGAIADGATVARAQAQGHNARDFLDNNDAYHFFAPLDDLLITGPTNTNVNDLIVMLVE